MQTAEDSNAYDRPETVFYVTADNVEMWKQAQNSDVAARIRVPFDAREFIAKVNGTQDSDVDGFIKVDHETPTNPVAINSEVWTYSYDANGNVDSIVSSTGERIYGYDNLNRLTQDTRGPTQTIEYDRNGNRTSDAIDAVTNTYDYVLNSNQLHTDPTGTVEHDAVVTGAVARGVVLYRPRRIGVQLVAVEDVVVGIGQGIDAIAGASEVGLPRRAE